MGASFCKNCAKSKDDLITIVQGQRKELLVVILDPNCEAKTLSGVGEIFSVHPKVKEGFLIKKKSDSIDPIEILSGTNIIKIPLNTSDTVQLRPQDRETFFVAIDFPTPLGRQIFKIEDGYNVCQAGFTLS